MPPKAAKGNDNKKVLKGTNNAPLDLVKNLLLEYEARCKAERQQIAAPLRLQMKKCIDDDMLLAKIILEHKLRNPPKPKKVDKKKRPGAGGSRKKDAFVLKRLPPDNDKLPLTFEPLIAAIRTQRYMHLKDLFIWGIIIPEATSSILCEFLEQGSYPIRTLSLQDNMLSANTVSRLGRAVSRCKTVQTLDLDFNEFGDEGCEYLCDALSADTHLLSLSLCYCNLSAASGSSLAKVVSATFLKDLYLNGNDLGTKGITSLVQPLLDYAVKRAEEKSLSASKKAELEKKTALDLADQAAAPADASSTVAKAETGAKKAGKKKKGKTRKRRKKSAKKASPPMPGPWISKLHLADNGVHYKKNPVKDQGLMETLACMTLLSKLIAMSEDLRELDLDDNWIGDTGGRDLLLGLKLRQQRELPKVSVKVNYRMEASLLAEILKLGSGGTLKKKRGKRTKKKK